MPALSVAEAAAVLKPAAVRYLRAVQRGTPRAADRPFVVQAQETDGVGDLVAGDALTPRGRAILVHLDGYDGESAEDVLDATAIVLRTVRRAESDVRAWNHTATIAYNGFGLDLDGAWGIWDVYYLVGRRTEHRTLRLDFDRYGRVKATLREVQSLTPRAQCTTVAWVTAASVAEALESLGGADRAHG